MSSIYDWSAMAASNANADTLINWQEGQPPSSVNNSARAMMQRLRELVSDLGGVARSEGSTNQLTLAAKSPFAAYVDGIRLCFRASTSNTAAATLNVNAVGARPIFLISNGNGIAPLAAGNLTAGGIYEVVYSTALDNNSGGWLLLNPTMLLRPVGALELLAAPVTPPGFLYCNGQAVSRSLYAALFHVLGNKWGDGDGKTTFNLPDYRGTFLRSWDDGRGLDSGRAFASLQHQQLAQHQHSFSGQTAAGGAHAHGLGRGPHQGAHFSAILGATLRDYTIQTDVAGEHVHHFSGSTAGYGGSETRPVNNTIHIAIKF